MSFSAGSGKGPQADINVTPLVDIVLVLLIIFMVITPMLQRGPEVKLPPVKNSESKEDSSEDLLISVAKTGEVYLDEDLITMDLLERELQAELIADPFKPILIKGDVTTKYGDIRRVMELCESVGAKSVALMADKSEDLGALGGKKPKEEG